ncbi:MAG: hypothetical protein D3904_03380 [Candidatus Electrothrix sp. EH2]|nr:hypothetical protein [Candidatus Electrothrix sp. EH2]
MPFFSTEFGRRQPAAENLRIFVAAGLFDTANGNRISVMRFDGMSWVQVGAAGLTPSFADISGLAFDSNGTPYVAYMDAANSDRASVMKFDGMNWVQVGIPGFTASTAAFETNLAIDSSDTPYVAYMDNMGSGIGVMRFNGFDWVQVGTSGFPVNAEFPTLAINGIDKVYLAYTDASITLKRNEAEPGVRQLKERLPDSLIIKNIYNLYYAGSMPSR